MGKPLRRELPPLNFFRERGFVRKSCSCCGGHFWTLDLDRETCGEAPCEPYSFIGKGLPNKFTVDEAREAFLSFMEREGHTRVNRYPVLAKWRDDLFLTSASIADFQPYVTSGLIPPPANPLTISQPCIRLTDIDKVGRTVGRHLTVFEMMAHHAFNTPKHHVYWMDRTVELFHGYATEVLGVPGEDITYKEGFWEGGGNAGLDVEPMIAGMEVATLVFMNLRAGPHGYEEMENRIVDTGYGLERIVWLSRGTPSAFEAVYGNMVGKFLELLGVEGPDQGLLSSYTELSSGMAGMEAGISRAPAKAELASKLGIDALELQDIISKLESVYSVLDHTKAISFVLADGAVPSNAQEGYLCRVLVRRCLRKISSLGADVKLSELVDSQLDYWGSKFPELLEKRRRILEIVDLEEERYEKTIGEGVALVSNRARRLRREGKKKISTELLVELYDSHGIPPEIVSSTAPKYGIQVDVPENFYELVASKHESAAPKPAEVSPYVDVVDEFPETRALYYEDPYLGEFEARIMGLVGDAIITDRTAFYPEGGGHPADTGSLLAGAAEFRVESVEKVKGRILHHVSGENIRNLRPGNSISGRIDTKRRLSLMRHHTATHIILASAKRVLGDHVWQWGAQKGPEGSRLDVNHYKAVSREELNRIEMLANEAVMKNLPVRTFPLPRGEAESRYGFTIYQGGLVPGVSIRIVEIDGFNVQACGGVHVTRTGDVGPIKIWRSKRIQDGVVRLEFSAGEAAVERLISYYDELRNISEALHKPPEEAAEALEGVFSEMKGLRKSLERERMLRLRSEARRALSSPKVVKGVRLAWTAVGPADQDSMVQALDEVISKEEDSVVLLIGSSGEKRILSFMAGSKAVDAGISAGEVLREIAKELGGGGGGSDRLGRGSVPISVPEEAIGQKVMKSARDKLGGS